MRRMTSRRAFLRHVSTGLLTSAAAPFLGATPASAQGTAGGGPKHPFTGQIGLQLYSLRHLFKKGDVAGTLAMVENWGLTNVELAGTYGMSAAEYAALLKKTGLRAVSTHADFNRLSTGIDGVIADAQTFGVEYLGCAWIPHSAGFTAADAAQAAKVFNEAGKRAKAANLRFFYHIHGYEFQPGPDGTLFDTLAKQTDPALVAFEMDVFWAVRGGAVPVDLFAKYPDRFPLTHLKDMKKGTAVGDPTGQAPDESNVPLGEGMIDWPPLVRAANRAAAKYHFIEDEAPNAEQQIPKTLQYLAALKV
jgi:sugar phosphate isomerase/epimerase